MTTFFFVQGRPGTGESFSPISTSPRGARRKTLKTASYDRRRRLFLYALLASCALSSSSRVMQLSHITLPRGCFMYKVRATVPGWGPRSQGPFVESMVTTLELQETLTRRSAPISEVPRPGAVEVSNTTPRHINKTAHLQPCCLMLVVDRVQSGELPSCVDFVSCYPPSCRNVRQILSAASAWSAALTFRCPS